MMSDSAMNTLHVMLLVGLMLLSAPGARARQTQSGTGSTSPDVDAWLAAVDAHTPGIDDHALQTIKSLSPTAFEKVARVLASRRQSVKRLPLAAVTPFNRLVHRGALLHMDAAMVLADDITARPLREPRPSRFNGMAVLSTDGGFDGLDVTERHWEFGRTLLDLTLPQPSEDRTARLWYVTAAAILANRSLLADQSFHLRRANAIFPNDPDLLFANGCYYETLASPRVRPVIDSTIMPPHDRITAPSSGASWRLAEDFFRRASEARPDFAAARIRRGRTLDMLGRHVDAIRELRAGATHTADPALLYYAALFEGAAQESLGNVTMARESYERAAAGFPNAQSPQLALSRIARDRGDRATALAAAQRVFTREVQSEMDDPWWTYHLWFVRNLDELLAELRQPFMPAAAATGAWR